MAFKGVYTALVTPFTSGGEVDYAKLEELVEQQIAGGVAGLVPVGTTGESPTLSMEEHLKVIETVARRAAGRCEIIAGTGANSTAEALELTEAAKSFGVDGTLQVTPYYNKPSAAGLVKHFSAVADLGLPVVLYNVPGRTGREIPLEVIEELAAHPNVVAVKEAGGSVERVSRILDRCEITVLSGDDSLALPMISVGAQGVISVASNLIPAEMTELVNAALEGDYARAQALHRRFHPLFGALFIETNPVPVKAAMAMRGLIEEVYRLPLCPMEPANRARLEETMRAAGLL